MWNAHIMILNMISVQVNLFCVCFRAGLVSRVCAPDQLVDEAVKTAEKIAGYSKLIVGMCKEAVNAGTVAV